MVASDWLGFDSAQPPIGFAQLHQLLFTLFPADHADLRRLIAKAIDSSTNVNVCLLRHAGMPSHAEVLRHESMLTHYFS
jgi:hypothetical protein